MDILSKVGIGATKLDDPKKESLGLVRDLRATRRLLEPK